MSKLLEKENKILPGSFEIETKEFLKMIKEEEIKNQKMLNDLKVYSKVISLILTIQMKYIDGIYYVPMSEIQQICKDEFKHLSKNWKE